jgi:serine/threonine-protein kinase
VTGDDRVTRVVRAVANAQAVAWEEELSAAESGECRALLESLRTLSDAARAGDAAEIDALPDAVADITSSVDGSWGAFRLVDELGRGAYGTVYRAYDHKLDRQVALKIFAADATRTSEGFVEEGRILARLRHPNIVAVYGAETHEGRDGVWMELIHGRTYEEIVRTDGSLGPREAALIGADLCRAVGAVHTAGISHRDITARNIMREVGGRVVLLDFGAGRRWSIEEGSLRLAGTPLYLPPEVLSQGVSPSASTDFYSIGVLLFYLTTGTFPIAAATLSDLHAAHAAGKYRRLHDVRPDLPASFVGVVERAISPDPRARFANAVDMASALLRSVDVEPGRATGGTEIPRSVLGSFRRPVPAWAALLVAAIAVAVVMGVNRFGPEAPAVRGVRALSDAQWPVFAGYLDLADEAGERGAWKEAADLYERATVLLTEALGTDDEPVRAVTLAKRAWALARAGDFRGAHGWNDLAIYKLVQETRADHPWLVTMELAKAEFFEREGKLSEALAAVNRAVAIHQQMLASIGVPAKNGPPLAGLASGSGGLCADADGDWLLDIFERAANLDPSRPDSNGDGRLDDEEDSNGDGVTNGVAWPYGCDPRRVVAQYGATDPLRLGFRLERHFESGAAGVDPAMGEAWQVRSPMGFYYWKLTQAQKNAAISRGWRMRTRLALRDGNGFVDLDLVPHAGRFDLGFFGKQGGEASFLLMESSQPRKGEWLKKGAAGPMPLVEFAFSPSEGAARLKVNGETERAGYQGYRQYQEDFGLFFGATNDLGSTKNGVVDIALCWLVIR